MSYDPDIHTGESFDILSESGFGIQKQTVLVRYDGGHDFGSPIPFAPNNNSVIFSQATNFNSGSAMWLPSIQIDWSSNKSSYHEHEWQLRIINYRIVAECKSCNETCDEDAIIEALRDVY
jgi:hypothetical protein